MVWLSGGRIKWRTIQTVLDAGYADAFRVKHPDDPGLTVPAGTPQVRLDYAFLPAAYADQIAGGDVVEHPDVAIASTITPSCSICSRTGTSPPAGRPADRAPS